LGQRRPSQPVFRQPPAGDRIRQRHDGARTWLRYASDHRSRNRAAEPIGEAFRENPLSPAHAMASRTERRMLSNIPIDFRNVFPHFAMEGLEVSRRRDSEVTIRDGPANTPK
jgi:hypothetical protein